MLSSIAVDAVDAAPSLLYFSHLIYFHFPFRNQLASVQNFLCIEWLNLATNTEWMNVAPIKI